MPFPLLLTFCHQHSFFLISTREKMRKEILPFVMTMLLNPYPRVRRYTAEQLYAKLAEDGDMMFDDDHGCLEEANKILLSTVWDEEHDPRGQLSESRNCIADLLGISLPESNGM